MKHLSFFILLIVSTLASGQSLVQRMDSLMQAHTTPTEPGVALLVMKDGKVLIQKGYGLADKQTKIGISTETNFRMASVSKQFTAMSIALLHKQGKLSFEDNLLKFFPEFNAKVGTKIKLRHLLTHTSGVWDYEDLIPATQQAQVLDADVLGLLQPKDSMYFEPGAKFQYSNSGFCLLAMVVEKVSGMSFPAFVEKQIFKPLGMNNTFIYDTANPQPNRAMGYARNEKREMVLTDQSITSATKGDGCVYTSLTDYQKWHKALLNNRFIKLEKTLQDIGYLLDKHQHYGLGWFFVKRKDGSIEMSHTGSTCGFSNIVVRIPSQQLLIIYFSNIANNRQPYLTLFKLFQSIPDFPTSQLWDVEPLTR